MEQSKINYLVVIIITINLILLFPAFSVNAGSGELLIQEDQIIDEIIESMTPEEKVGQLLLISFQGANIEISSAIYDLIVNHHIGGVVLSRTNNNFVNDETIVNAYQLISGLQTIEWESSDRNSVVSTEKQSQYIPLLIGISQEGDLYPFDGIIDGMTALPNQMAIGATWQPENANTIGAILGSELKKIGFNLLLGPSLDVYAGTPLEGVPDLGSRTFGGDPYWVGEMGKAYIEGVHTGSENQVIVISKHFPGAGDSDRPPDQEIPTIRKSLEQLKQIELAPFFSVTGNAPTELMTTDGILVSHIRYQGFQGNIRATTKPVSFDAAALEQLMAIEEFSSWRQEGGIMVSDNLGSDAVRRFYDPTGQSFDARQVARNAFLAGNDILYLDNFIATGDPDEYSTIIRTLDSFTQKYKEDQAFSQRVDASVKRILRKKIDLYPNFNYSAVITDIRDLDQVGISQDNVFGVAQSSSTLISPSKEDLNADLGGPPGVSDRILFITDVMMGKQCEDCQGRASLQVNSLEKSVIKLYGPDAAGQILQYNISSYSFADLTKVLEGTLEDSLLPEELVEADWIVFGLLNPIKERPESYALKKLLTEKPELVRDKVVIVFAFNAPYYLDATDISKITAYYGLYSKVPQYINVAARLLFQEIPPTGALPVNVPGVGYDLITATSPNPDQIISLYIDRLDMDGRQPRPATTLSTIEPANLPILQIGDTLQFRTGVIYDHNNLQVPDGTVVRFIITSSGEFGTSQQIETTTRNGVAQATYLIQASGIYDVGVVSDPALNSDIIQINIEEREEQNGAEVEEVVITQTFEPTEIATNEPDVVNQPPIPSIKESPDSIDWLLSMLIIWCGGIGVYWFGKRRTANRWSVRWALMAIIGGTTAYLYLAIGLPGSSELIGNARSFGIMIVVIVGSLLGWLVGYIWDRRASK